MFRWGSQLSWLGLALCAALGSALPGCSVTRTERMASRERPVRLGFPTDHVQFQRPHSLAGNSGQVGNRNLTGRDHQIELTGNRPPDATRISESPSNSQGRAEPSRLSPGHSFSAGSTNEGPAVRVAIHAAETPSPANSSRRLPQEEIVQLGWDHSESHPSRGGDARPPRDERTESNLKESTELPMWHGHSLLRSGGANPSGQRPSNDSSISIQGFTRETPSPSISRSGEVGLAGGRLPDVSPNDETNIDGNRTMSHVPVANAVGSLVIDPDTPISVADQFLEQAERAVEDSRFGPTETAKAEFRRRHVYLRMLYLMTGRHEQALTVIPDLDEAEQEYWQQLLWAAANSLDTEQFPKSETRAAQAIAPLNSALNRLRDLSELTLKNMAFCQQIANFGNFAPFPKNEFTKGQTVVLYVEVENFGSEPTADGMYRTSLRSIIEILGPNGEVRWPKTFPATEDVCRNPRRDYYHNYKFAVPETLSIGPHSLRLTVIDDLTGKQSSQTLKFVVK